MGQIISRAELAPNIIELRVAAPRIATKAQAGQFVIAMADEYGERIPLTIADFDRQEETVTLVLMVVGASSLKLSRLRQGQRLYALLGPLGHPSEIQHCDTVVMVAGGVGTAPVYPIARAYHEAGSRVVTIQGARSKQLLFWTERLASVGDQHLITTDDGSRGHKGLVTQPLEQLLGEDTEQRIGCVYAIGPAVMMKFCCDTTRPHGVKTVVSLNSIMIDGTGMCGGCRVEIAGRTKFTCVDGPEFNGHEVDWDLLLSRQTIYVQHEQCSIERLVHDG